MDEDTSYDEKPTQASYVTSKERTSSDVTKLTGSVVEVQPHRTGRPIFWPDKFKPLRAARSDREMADSGRAETTQSEHQHTERKVSSPSARIDAQEADQGADSKAGKDTMHLRGGDLEEDCCAGLFGGLCLSFACLQVFCPDPQ